MPFVLIVTVALPFFIAFILPLAYAFATFVLEDLNVALPIFPVILSVVVLPFVNTTDFLTTGFFTVTV